MKLLTEQVLIEKFKEGYGFDPEDATPDDPSVLAKLQEYYGFEIVETYANNADFYIYEESTADGYTVYVATSNQNSVCVSEDIYYYDSDLYTLVEEVLVAGDTLATDKYEHWFVQAIEGILVVFVEEIMDEVRSELLDEGYVEQITAPSSTLGLLDMIHQRMITTESDEYLYCVPTQTESTSGDDLRLISFYKQICNDPNSFRKYVRKVLNCQLSLPGNDTIKLTLIPLT